MAVTPTTSCPIDYSTRRFSWDRARDARHDTSSRIPHFVALLPDHMSTRPRPPVDSHLNYPTNASRMREVSHRGWRP
jgi:hypothetical protein